MGKLSRFFRAVRRHGAGARLESDQPLPPSAVATSSGLVSEDKIRRALAEGEFDVHYQPLTDIKTGLIVGAEALVRWHEPTSGLLLPAEFIPLAEDSGLIIELGDWVLRTASKQLRAFHEAGFIGMKISVNVSAKQFESLDFFDIVASALRRSHLVAEYLQLEITETTAMKNPAQTAAILGRLHEMGVKVAIDDFGTGYSSLASLKQFPLDELKIDRSFIKGCTSDPDDAAIVMAVVSLARGMGLTSVAEGVETQRQLEYLRTLQCNTMQGFLGGAAMPADAFAKLLRGGDNPFDSIAALP